MMMNIKKTARHFGTFAVVFIVFLLLGNMISGYT